MPFKVTSWNINSVRLRIDLVTDFLKSHQPDVLCLQETKCPDGKFPSKAFTQAGYEHLAIHGQNGYNGVCIASKHPIIDQGKKLFYGKEDARHVQASFENGVTVHNFYVPAGGDVPDLKENDKFDHKLNFLTEMRDWWAAEKPSKSVLVGDLNIAPHENDVWSHKQLLKVVSHTPVETDLLEEMRQAGDWVDVARALFDDDEKLYSWWSYRAKDWRKSNRGRRLDHIWLTGDLKASIDKAGRDNFDIFDEARGWEKPSDHAPISFTFEV